MKRFALSAINQLPGKLGLSLLLAWLLVLPAASLAVPVLSQGFQSNQPLTSGTIVSLDKQSSNLVLAANTDNVENLFGVVVSSGNALLSLSSQQKNQVQVATSGVANVIVSDLNGDIVTGDKITASPLAGVGMKATDNIRVVGVAQADLRDSTGKQKQTVKDQKGQQREVQLGVIPVLVDVAYYFKQPEKTVIPSALQNIANAISGKKPSPLPVIISLIIFAVALVSIIALIYSAIRNSIISIGRNPLAQAAVTRSLVQILGLILTIMGGAVAAIYLILTRL